MDTLNIKRKAYYMNASDREEADTVDTPLKPLISVIVPIYNVEKYVRKCLESLRGQTLKQIEVICIDDGSTDRSGEIADEYENMDGWPVIRVIHTENRGLSAARNRGIDESRSQWLMFVDSDDWVDREFCRIPYEAAVENKADMVIFGVYDFRRGKVEESRKIGRSEGIINREVAIDDGGVAVWNKLFHNSLFESIRYPDGHVYEDLATTHKLVYSANIIIKIKQCLYFYRYRRGSIANSSNDIDDLLEMSKQRYKELIECGYPREKAYAQLLESAYRYCGKAQTENNGNYREALNIVEKGSQVCLGGKTKIKRKLFIINRSLYRFVYKIVICARRIV